MKNNTMNKKANMGSSFLAVLLAVLVMLEICSATVLFGQLLGMSAATNVTYISLTDGTEGSVVHVKELKTTSNAAAPYYIGTLSTHSGQTDTEAEAQTLAFAEDENTEWSTHTDVEIFSLKYDNNGDAKFTVVSGDGDKVLAPGTQGEYKFSLKNEKPFSLDYTLTAEAYFKGDEDLWIPIKVRMMNDDGFMVGGRKTWEDVQLLNDVKEEDVIAAGNVRNYTLQWQWPFERGTGANLSENDRYDTMLGNEAVGKDLELHIILKTRAEADKDPGKPGGKPEPTKTGDANDIRLWILAEFIGIASVIFVIVEKRRLDKASAENTSRGMQRADA